MSRTHNGRDRGPRGPHRHQRTDRGPRNGLSMRWSAWSATTAIVVPTPAIFARAWTAWGKSAVSPGNDRPSGRRRLNAMYVERVG